MGSTCCPELGSVYSSRLSPVSVSSFRIKWSFTLVNDHQSETMAAKYSFPYHHLAEIRGDNWKTHRHLYWGYEYLGYLNAVIGEVTSRSPRRLLEVGCGDGRLIAELLNAGLSGITGIDTDERAVLFAKAFNFGQDVSIHAGDVRQLEAGDFDGAVAMEVLEHIPESELPSIVKAIWERTEPAAFLVITVPTTNVPVTSAHFRHYDLELLKRHLEPFFQIKEFQFLHKPGRVEKLLRKLAMNRLFVLNETRLLRMVSRAYRSVALAADSSNGSHLLAVAHRVDTA